MTVDVKVPVLAESIPDATLLEWRKRPGDRVEQDEILIELETDKVVLEVPAPAAGILAEVLKQTGDMVLSQEVLARIDSGESASAAAPGAGAGIVSGIAAGSAPAASGGGVPASAAATVPGSESPASASTGTSGAEAPVSTSAAGAGSEAPVSASPAALGTVPSAPAPSATPGSEASASTPAAVPDSGVAAAADRGRLSPRGAPARR